MTESPPKLTPPPNGSALLRENLFEEKKDDDDGELLKRREPTMLLKGKKLIAPPSDGTKRYTVVFDLDETVVYARDGPLYARAYLKDLFRFIKDDFEVIVWTAGERDYAKCILEEINEDHIIQHLVYRHEKWFREEDYTKDLRQLGRDLNYTLMIENTPDCVRANPQNSIIVEDFEVLPETTEEEGSMPTSPVPTPPPPPAQAADMIPTADEAKDTAALQASSTAAAARSAAEGGGGSGGSQSPLRRRRTTDRTLFLLRELLQSLLKSGDTVPRFLASCELLSRQTVIGSDGSDIPIYHLGTRRRRKDAGVQRKQVRVNRDKSSAAAAPAEATSPSQDAPAESAAKEKTLPAEDSDGSDHVAHSSDSSADTPQSPSADPPRQGVQDQLECAHAGGVGKEEEGALHP
ncbi:TFIIF-stimulated CTD phosphatase, putative [Leishmania guyanensis]|uniref:Mitochondrial import inner membrane translocase subunit TIM50 n=3 Tax=Leishmania guyanensis species complex TaxID=38579 RepID=A0AAW3B8Z1_9TRYP